MSLKSVQQSRIAHNNQHCNSRSSQGRRLGRTAIKDRLWRRKAEKQNNDNEEDRYRPGNESDRRDSTRGVLQWEE